MERSLKSMKEYRVETVEKFYQDYYVEAESKEEAKEMVLNGDVEAYEKPIFEGIIDIEVFDIT